MARRHGVNDASVQHGYFGLFMGKDAELGTPQTVAPDARCSSGGTRAKNGG